MFSTKNRFVVSRNKDIDYKAIIEHLSPSPKDIENYHIDHVIPLDFFDLTNSEHIKKAMSPINHCWLLSCKNISKNNLIDFIKYPKQKKVWDELNLGELFGV